MKEPLLTRSFLLLTASDLAYFSGAGVLLVATPLLISGPLGGEALQVGLAMGSFSLTTLLLRPWLGRWTDRHGRRTLLVGGAAAFAVVVTAHLLVETLWALVLVRLLLGAAEACYFVAGFAALADLAPPSRAGEALSLNSLALYTGIGVGPLLGQGLLAVGGFPAAWLGTSALVAVAAGLVAVVPETSGNLDPDAPPTPLLHPLTFLPGTALGFGLLTMSGFMAFSVLLSREVGVRPWSLALLVFGATVVVCRLAFAKLPDRAPALPLAVAALVAAATGMVLIGAVPTTIGMLVGALVCGTGSAFLTPAVFGLVFRAVPVSERGSAAASLSLFVDVGLTGGPMLLGVLATPAGLPVGFMLMAAIPVVGAIVLTGQLARETPTKAVG